MCKTPEGGLMRNEHKSTLLSRVSWAAALFAMTLVGCYSTPAFAQRGDFPDLESLLRQTVPPESISPPYKIEVWIESVHGLPGRGTRDLLEDCLREELRALGDVEFVKFPHGEKQGAPFRLRVWFTELERPDQYECFDLTIAVVVERIFKGTPVTGTIIDSYALAGIKFRDLSSLCTEIVTRFDVRILSLLRKMGAESKSH